MRGNNNNDGAETRLPKGCGRLMGPFLEPLKLEFSPMSPSPCGLIFFGILRHVSLPSFHFHGFSIEIDPALFSCRKNLTITELPGLYTAKRERTFLRRFEPCQHYLLFRMPRQC